MYPGKNLKIVATLGVFDGVHKGHQKIIKKVVSRARAVSGKSVVITFDVHPNKVLAPDKCPLALTNADMKSKLFKKLGVSVVVVMPFNRQSASVTAEKFVENFLVRKLHVKELVVSRGLRFGKGAKGDIGLLKKLGKKYYFRLLVLSPCLEGRRVISSTWVRALVQQGRVEKASKLLGYPYSLQGRVVKGDRRGRKLGFPTANFKPEHGVAQPSRGVYAIYGIFAGRMYPGVCNVGIRPTYKRHGAGTSEIKPLVEAHFFKFQGNLYGKRIIVRMVKKLRSEKAFKSADSLKRQIGKDVVKAKKILSAKKYSR